MLINTLSKWEKNVSRKEMDIKNFKVSNRATAVSQLLASCIGEQETMKITGDVSSSSMKPYVQLNTEHHQNMLKHFI